MACFAYTVFVQDPTLQVKLNFRRAFPISVEKCILGKSDTTLSFMLKTFFIGFVLAAIPGPGSMLFLQYLWRHGFRTAMYFGLGSTIADIIYGIIAVLSVSTLVHLFNAWQVELYIAGGVFLIYLAIREWKNSSKEQVMIHLQNTPAVASDLIAFFVAFLYVMFNPGTILLYMGFLSVLKHVTVASVVMGVLLGCMSWWIIFGALAYKLQSRIIPTPFWSKLLHRGFAIALALLGSGIIVKTFI